MNRNRGSVPPPRPGQTHGRRRIRTNANARKRTHARTHPPTHPPTIPTHTHTHTHTRARTNTNKHKQTNPHTHTHTHTLTHSLTPSLPHSLTHSLKSTTHSNQPLTRSLMLELGSPPSASLSARAADTARRTANAKGSPRAVSSLNLAMKWMEGSTRGGQRRAGGLPACVLRKGQLVHCLCIESSCSCFTLMRRMCQLIASATSPEAPVHIFSLPRHIQAREPPLPGILTSMASRRRAIQSHVQNLRLCWQMAPLPHLCAYASQGAQAGLRRARVDRGLCPELSGASRLTSSTHSSSESAMSSRRND